MKSQLGQKKNYNQIKSHEYKITKWLKGLWDNVVYHQFAIALNGRKHILIAYKR